ncbi:hypothetical protein NFJ02_08g137070 [Pycnococcus provasolii]
MSVILGCAIFTKSATFLVDVPLASSATQWSRASAPISKLVLGLHSLTGPFASSGVALAPNTCVGAADGRDCVAAVAVRTQDAHADASTMALARLAANAAVLAFTRELGSLVAAFAREDHEDAAAAMEEYTAAAMAAEMPTPRGTPASATLMKRLDRFGRDTLRPLLKRVEAGIARGEGAASAFAAGAGVRALLAALVEEHADAVVRVHALPCKADASRRILATWPSNAPSPGALECAAADAAEKAEKKKLLDAASAGEGAQLMARWRADGRVRGESAATAAERTTIATSTSAPGACCYVALVPHGCAGELPLLVTVAVRDATAETLPLSDIAVAVGKDGAAHVVLAASDAAVSALSGRLVADPPPDIASAPAPFSVPLLIASPPEFPAVPAALGPRARRLVAPQGEDNTDIVDGAPATEEEEEEHALHKMPPPPPPPPRDLDPLPPRASTPTDPAMLIEGVRDLVAKPFVAPAVPGGAPAAMFTPSDVQMNFAETPMTAPRPPEAPKPSAGFVRRRVLGETADDVENVEPEVGVDNTDPPMHSHAEEVPFDVAPPKRLPALSDAPPLPAQRIVHSDGDVLRHDLGADASAAATALLQKTYVMGTGLSMDVESASRAATASAGAPERA